MLPSVLTARIRPITGAAATGVWIVRESSAARSGPGVASSVSGTKNSVVDAGAIERVIPSLVERVPVRRPAARSSRSTSWVSVRDTCVAPWRCRNVVHEIHPVDPATAFTHGREPVSEFNTAGFDVCIRGPYRFTRNLTGTIYLACGAEPFPAAAWSDFPVIVLSWWVKAAIQLRLGHTRAAELLFMDGPFAMRVDKRNSRWHLVGVRQHLSGADDVLLKCDVPEREAMEALQRAATDLVQTCHREQWITNDLTNLEQQLPDLAP
jgi:hypothetical protein